MKKIPFTSEEIKKIWEIVEDVPFADMILIEIYTGFRPIEMAEIKNKNVHLDENYIIGGTKTQAGNR